MQGRDQSHRRLQNETECHRTARAIEDVSPNAIMNFDRESVPHQPFNDEDDNNRNSQSGQENRAL
jgi:hypothetical protein